MAPAGTQSSCKFFGPSSVTKDDPLRAPMPMLPCQTRTLFLAASLGQQTAQMDYCIGCAVRKFSITSFALWG